MLVAFTITALTLGVLFQTFGRGARATATAADYSRAIAVAESILAQAGAEEDLAAGEIAGETDDGFRWSQTTIEHVAPMDEGADADRPLVMEWEVAVEVAWTRAQRERSLQLLTLRLGPP